MNREIIAVAFGAKCGGLAASESGRFSPGFGGPPAASSPSARSRSASANAPTPEAERARNARRVTGSGSIDIQELAGGEELLAQVGEGGQFGVGRLRLPREGGLVEQGP